MDKDKLAKLDATPERVWIRPIADGKHLTLRHWSLEPFEHGTEYVRANALVPRAEMEEAVGLLRGLANGYELLCRELGRNYCDTPSSYYSHARTFLARQEAERG